MAAHIGNVGADDCELRGVKMVAHMVVFDFDDPRQLPR